MSLGSSISYIFSLKNGHDLFFNVSLGSLIAVLNEIDFLGILQITVITKGKTKGMEENHKIKQNFFRKACGIDCLEAKKIIHKICET